MTTHEGEPAQPVAALAGAVDDLQGAQWWRLSDGELRASVLELERQAHRLEAARLRLLAEADARGVGRSAGAVSTGHWLASEAGARPERAAERVTLARAVAGGSAATGAALAAGDLSYDHACVVTRTTAELRQVVGPGGVRLDAATLAEAEAFLVEHAAVLDPRQLARVARQLRHRLDPRAGEPLAREEDGHATRRGLALCQADDGRWLLAGELDAVRGATLAAALDPLSEPDPAVDGRADTRSARTRRADAVVALAQAWLAGHHGGEGADGPASSRPQVVVTVPLETVTDPTAPGTAPGVLDGGAPVSADTVGVLSCDAAVVPVLLDGAGVPLDVGRTVYAFPDRLRTAVRVRDQHCTWHGCTRPAPWCDIHHLVAFSTGGATSERNGALLCGPHHRLAHRTGWRGELVGAQVVWHPPDREQPLVPPPPWRPALDRVVTRWRQRVPGRAAA